MSIAAISAALARENLSAAERLVAFSLASFADRENRAWPGAPAAAARAGLSRSRCLQARDQLVRRCLVVMEDAATGRGRSSTLALTFADEGPWCEGEINAPLFEAALGHSRARGPARLLLATMAALANEERVMEDLTTEQLCSAAGLADRTYRRARQALLASGELVLLSGVGGRGNANRWEISDPRLLASEPGRPSASRCVPPPAGVRPLVAPVAVPVISTSHESPRSFDLEPVPAARKGGQDQTLSVENCPILTGVSGVKGGHDRTLSPQNGPILTGVSGVKGGQDQTLFVETQAERAARTPAKTPAPNARAGKEPQNQRPKEQPPNPPQGGPSDNSITIEETYTTGIGRKRHRRVNVNLDEVRRTLGVPGPCDHADWKRIRKLLVEAVGESTFAIWLEPVELIAIDADGALVLHAPPELRGWLQERFGRVVAQAAERAGRATRMADEGGVGKTTTAINVSVLLAGRGERVLAIDTDPQFALTRQLGIEIRSLRVNLVDVLAGRADMADAIVADVHGVDVIPGARELAGVEMSLVGEMGRERFLHNALNPVIAGYQRVVIDTPPNLGLLTVNALVCADTVLAPVSAEDEASVQGIVELRATIAKLERLGGSRPRLLALLTRWAPRRIISEVIDEALIELDLPPVARIPARAAVAQAAAAHVPLAVSARDGAVAFAYDRLIDHVAEVVKV